MQMWSGLCVFPLFRSPVCVAGSFCDDLNPTAGLSASLAWVLANQHLLFSLFVLLHRNKELPVCLCVFFFLLFFLKDEGLGFSQLVLKPGCPETRSAR